MTDRTFRERREKVEFREALREFAESKTDTFALARYEESVADELARGYWQDVRDGLFAGRPLVEAGVTAMIASPRIGQQVQVWYRAGVREKMPHHGRVGIIRVVCHGRPRNHGIELDGVVVPIPCGNLRKPGAGDTARMPPRSLGSTETSADALPWYGHRPAGALAYWTIPRTDCTKTR